MLEGSYTQGVKISLCLQLFGYRPVLYCNMIGEVVRSSSRQGHDTIQNIEFPSFLSDKFSRGEK